MLSPFKIIHKDKPERAAAEQIAAAASDNLRLPRRERQLLCYYASCSTGFAPALKLVEKECNIAANKISEIRQKLAGKKMILIDKDAIVIDWFRLRAFAMMERQSKYGALHARYGNRPGQQGRRVTIRELIDKIPPDPDFIPRYDYRAGGVCNPPSSFVDAILSMTVDEYRAWLAFPFPQPRARGVSLDAA